MILRDKVKAKDMEFIQCIILVKQSSLSNKFPIAEYSVH